MMSRETPPSASVSQLTADAQSDLRGDASAVDWLAYAGPARQSGLDSWARRQKRTLGLPRQHLQVNANGVRSDGALEVVAGACSNHKWLFIHKPAQPGVSARAARQRNSSRPLYHPTALGEALRELQGGWVAAHDSSPRSPTALRRKPASGHDAPRTQPMRAREEPGEGDAQPST